MANSGQQNGSTLAWPRLVVAALGVVLLVVGVRAAWRSDSATAPLVLGALLIVVALVFSRDLEELTWRWRDMLFTVKQYPPPGAVALGEIAEDLRELDHVESDDPQEEIERLRERVAELAARAEAAQRDAYAAVEAQRDRTRSIYADHHGIDSVREALELKTKVLDVISRVAAERGWKVESDLELYPAPPVRHSTADFALHTDAGLVLVETFAWRGGGNTQHLRGVAVEFTKRYADAVRAFLVLPDDAIDRVSDVQVQGGPGRGDVESERTLVVRLSDLEAELRALP